MLLLLLFLPLLLLLLLLPMLLLLLLLLLVLLLLRDKRGSLDAPLRPHLGRSLCLFHLGRRPRELELLHHGERVAKLQGDFLGRSKKSVQTS